MGWYAGGAAVSLVLAAFAFSRMRVQGSFYDAEVYGLTAQSHRRYALLFAVIAVALAAAAALRARAGFAILTIFTFAALFYLTSFLRGYESDNDG